MKKILIFASLIFICFSASGVFATGGVEINTASLEQLETLTGIGPVKAQAIINARPFSSVDDLIRVKGIREKTLQKIKEQGLAYVEGHTAQPTPIASDETPVDVPKKELIESLGPAANETAEITPPKTTAPVVYPSGLIFNEIMPSPEGQDAEKEWIEIYNQNNFEINLSNWGIRDGEGKTTIYIFPTNTKIGANKYLVLTRPQTKITLNNTGDKLTILWPNGKIADTLIYEKSPSNQSYNKINSGWVWSTNLTPGEENIIPASKEVSNKQKSISNQKNDIENKKLLASLAQDSPRLNRFELLFLIAIIIAILSAIIFYFFKKRLNKL